MSSGKQNILIIDDDLTIRKLITHHLKEKYNVFEAKNAQEGFDNLESEDIDLVLCDVAMDEMDGFTFCRRVREDEDYRVLPFIFVTAKSSLEDKTKAMESGGDDVITKPFEVEDLKLKVNALLRRSEIYKVYGAKKSLQNSFKEDTPKILLIDDDVSLAKLFQYNLKKAGFECEIAGNAEEGLKKAKANPPDIFISDIMMPKIDGFEFRKMILADEELKSIPFIFLTSKSEESDILEGYDLGIADYVVKTAGPRVIVAKVSAILKNLGKERQRVVSEVHSAADSLRAKVVPDKTPDFNGFEINQWHVPYKGIPGGDFLDYFKVDDDNLIVILGDVMGKKWGAWYFAIAYAGYVRSAIRMVLKTSKDYSPSEILQQVNDSVYKDAKVSEVFTTLSILMLNNKSGTIKYTGAGDLPLIFKKANNSEIKKIKSKGLLLGFSADGNYEDVTIDINKNDVIFLVTDGILETRNKDGEQFGNKKFDELLKNISIEDNAGDLIRKEFNEFSNEKYEDDVSLITIRVS